MIDIILVSFYKYQCLDETLNSIKKNTKYPYKLWVFDNKSPKTEQIKNVLFKYKDIISGAWLCDDNYISAPYWWGYKNLISQDSKYFVMTEGDVILPLDKGCWLTKSLAILENETQVGVVSIRTKPHFPDDTLEYINWYNSWIPYKKYKDIFKCDQIIWHNLVIKKEIINKWEKNGYDYFWYDGHFRNKMKESGYDCVGLDWDAYHYANKESLDMYPEYSNYTGVEIFKIKYVLSEKNLTKII